MSGKGSSPRSPFPTFFYDDRTPFQKYSDNWDAVFGNKTSPKHCGIPESGCSLYDQSIVDCDCDCEPCSKSR